MTTSVLLFLLFIIVSFSVENFILFFFFFFSETFLFAFLVVVFIFLFSLYSSSFSSIINEFGFGMNFFDILVVKFCFEKANGFFLNVIFDLYLLSLGILLLFYYDYIYILVF